MLGRFQVKGKTPGRRCGGRGGRGVRQFTYTIAVHADRGKQQQLTCKTNLSEPKCDL